MKCFIVLLLALVCSAVAQHMGCHSTTPVYGAENNYPIFEGTNGMVLKAKVDNGASYIVTVPNSGGNTTQTFYLTHLFGSPYEQGYAHGQLLGKEAARFINSTWIYIEANIEEALLPYLPEWLADMIAEYGLDIALDYVYDITKHFTDEDFYDEMHGMCDAAGIDFVMARRLHMIPGVTKGACSMMGAWGKAVPTSDDRLLQLRALDWDMTGPFRDFSEITVYHPDKGNLTQGHAWLNIGMVGFIGALTGMSEQQMGISEIGVSFPDDTWGPWNQTVIPIPGVPFIVLLRDILKYDNTIDDSISRMSNAHRTCDLILGVGDGKDEFGYFRAFQYSPWVLNVQDPANQEPLATWHPRIEDVVYYGMDWQCPSFNQVMSEQIESQYGNITAANSIQYITSVEQSGDNHLAYYDLTGMELYVAFAAPHTTGGPVEAYHRQFTHFDARALFNFTL